MSHPSTGTPVNPYGPPTGNSSAGKSWAHARARIAALSRDRADDDPELIEARRDYRAAKLADHIERALQDAPPLTEEQRFRIASILTRPAPAGDR